MATQLKPFVPPPKDDAPRRRAPWRQRLVDAERGITLGVRGDSTFFLHFFLATIIVGAAFVLGIGAVEWAVVLLALTLVLSAEMFNQVLRSVHDALGHQFDDSLKKAIRIGTAAVFLTMIGALITLALVFGRHVYEIFVE
ncbi:MAG: diacylglycerol kinase [Planctomycetaceae bacterium]